MSLTQSKRFALFSLLLLSFSLTGCDNKKIESGRIGDAAPDFSLPDQAGKVYTLSGYKGSVILLRFWADWCPSCKDEMPKIDEVFKDLKDKGLYVFGVNVKQGEQAVSAFVKEYDISFPTPMDKDAVTAKAYGVVGLPTTFIIGRDGKIREKVMGDMTKEDVERLVKPLL